jgi:hypothetical protein
LSCFIKSELILLLKWIEIQMFIFWPPLNFQTMNVCILLISIIFCFSGKAIAQTNFQQEANHAICVTLNDATRTLQGLEPVEYINNSPDTPGFLYFHLWPNGYRDNSTAFARQEHISGYKRFYFAREFLTHGTCESIIPDHAMVSQTTNHQPLATNH